MSPRSRRKAIMLVDNSASRRKKMYDILKLTGLDIYSASTGKEALQRLPRDQAQLVIVNTEEAAVGGVYFIKDLRTFGMGQKMKVIGASDVAEGRKDAASAGADKCIEVGIAPYEFLELVAESLGIQKIEIPPEQVAKRREIIEEVVTDYRRRTEEGKKSQAKIPRVQLFLPGGVNPLLALTDHAGKKKRKK